MKRSQLLPRTLTRGEPFNNSAHCVGIVEPCVPPGLTFDDKPAGMHFKGVKYGGVRPTQMGRYHMRGEYGADYDRVQMVRRKGRTGAWRDCLRIVGGLTGNPGAGVVNANFDHPVRWQDGHAVQASVWFLASSELPTPMQEHYFELRGGLTIRPKAEAYEALSVVLYSDRLTVKWWANGYDGAPIGRRDAFGLPRELELNVWHHLVMRMTPTANENEWGAWVRYDGKIVFSTSLLNPVRDVAEISCLMGGDEADSNERGGVFYYDEFTAMELST